MYTCLKQVVSKLYMSKKPCFPNNCDKVLYSVVRWAYKNIDNHAIHLNGFCNAKK